jgi:DNA-binding NarL/FixJ family response regulator
VPPSLAKAVLVIRLIGLNWPIEMCSGPTETETHYLDESTEPCPPIYTGHKGRYNLPSIRSSNREAALSMGEVREEKTAIVLDEHPLWLDALGQLLERAGVKVVGATTSANEALELLESEQPDMLVAELEFSDDDADGITTIRRACEGRPELRVVVLSAHDDSQSVDSAFAAGASVYCVKTTAPDDLASAIRQAFHHSIYFAGGRARRVSDSPERPLSEIAPELTRREIEILRLVAEGHSNSHLAEMLWVTEQTIKFHLSNIYRKLDVANRTEAGRWAQVHGLLPAATPESSPVSAALAS